MPKSKTRRRNGKPKPPGRTGGNHSGRKPDCAACWHHRPRAAHLKPRMSSVGTDR